MNAEFDPVEADPARPAGPLYVDPAGDSVYLLPQQVRAVLVKDVYEGYGERSLMLADRSVWNRPAWY